MLDRGDTVTCRRSKGQKEAAAARDRELIKESAPEAFFTHLRAERTSSS